jgi:hypothetical protein
MHLPNLIITALLALFIAGAGYAQEPVLPADPEQTPPPAGEPLPSPPPQLIAPEILPPPDVSPPPQRPDFPGIPELDAGFADKPHTPEADKRRQLVEFRKLRNRVQNEPEIRAALARAEAARTDLQKRKLLARYIDVYFARMLALAPADLKPYLRDRKREHLAALPQPRVRPGVFPTPPPSMPGTAPAAAATPTPSPGPTATPAVPVPSFFGTPTPSPSPAANP